MGDKVERRREYARQYYLKNRERILTHNKAYYHEHLEQAREYSRAAAKKRRILHKDEINARLRERYATDPVYRERKKEILKKSRERARERKIERKGKFMGGA